MYRLEKVWIHLLSLQLLVNGFFRVGWTTSLGKGKTLNFNWLHSVPIRREEGLSKLMSMVLWEEELRHIFLKQVRSKGWQPLLVFELGLPASFMITAMVTPSKNNTHNLPSLTLSLSLPLSVSFFLSVYINIYIYIVRESERGREGE